MKLEECAEDIAKVMYSTDPHASEHRKCADALADGIRIGLKAASKIFEEPEGKDPYEGLPRKEYEAMVALEGFIRAKIDLILEGKRDLPKLTEDNS